MITKELYKQIPDFPEYEISNMGNIRMADGTKVLVRGYLKPNGKKKELKCMLKRDGKSYSCAVGSIVAKLFVPNPCNYDRYVYRDMDCFNAKASNIEWVDTYDFAVYCFRGKMFEVHHDTREGQIKKLERNISTANLFLDFLKSNDVAKINGIVLLYDDEIKAAIRRQTINRDEQNECYQTVTYMFMEKCMRNAVVTSNLGGYLVGMVRIYFLQKRSKKRTTQFNDRLLY